MLPRSQIRLLFAAVLSLLLALVLVALLYATDLAFRVWAHLQDAPLWFAGVYGVALLAVLAVAATLLWRVVRGPRRGARSQTQVPPLSEAQLEQRMEEAVDQGVDVTTARRELEQLRQRRQAGEVHLVLFGQVSSGKSSLVRALIPGAEPDTDPRAGTTREVTRYSWTSPAGDRLTLSDLPGLFEPDGSLDAQVRAEAVRAHVVIYVVDGDLTRELYDQLQRLLELRKPLVLALNKTDLYSEAERSAIAGRLAERVSGAAQVPVVAVSAARRREVLRIHPDGREEWVTRDCEPRMDQLVAAVQRIIDEDPQALEQLRDSAVFTLAGQHLEQAERHQRRERSAAIVSEHTRKAVLGALAAVSPGADVVIQGYLGVRMVQALADLYQVPVAQVDVEKLLRTLSGRVGGLLPLTLALVGNVLKAFPGIGTLGGGALHAVAYGLLFDTVGRAVAHTLETRGRLATAPTLHSIEDMIGEDLESRTRRLARLALGKGQSGADGSKQP